MDGYRISLLSDIHVGALSSRKDVETAIRISNEHAVHAMAVVGDLGDQHVTDGVYDSMAPFKTHSEKSPDVKM